MTTCLLCSSPAVADGLCVPCGAKLWAARLWQCDMSAARARVNGARASAHVDTREAAVCEIDGPLQASTFLAEYESAKAARAATPLCSCGCTSHEEP
jgi:hypothetical protein